MIQILEKIKYRIICPFFNFFVFFSVVVYTLFLFALLNGVIYYVFQNEKLNIIVIVFSVVAFLSGVNESFRRKSREKNLYDAYNRQKKEQEEIENKYKEFEKEIKKNEPEIKLTKEDILEELNRFRKIN